MGPHTFNVDQAAQQSLAAGASIRAVDMNDGVALALALVADAGRAHAASANALAFAGEHRGAAQRMAERIEALLATREMHAMQ